MTLASHTYANKTLNTSMRAGEFRVRGEMVRSLPARKPVALARSPGARSLDQVIYDDAVSVMRSRRR